MIETKLNYKREESVRAALGSQHYLLESIMGEEFEMQGFRDLVMTCKPLAKGRKKQGMINYLCTHLPTKVLEFSGLQRGNMEWWCAALLLESSIPERGSICFLMAGWKNKHGVEAVVIRYHQDPEDILGEYTDRVNSKILTGYESQICWKDVVIRQSEMLPSIPGLLEVPKVKWRTTPKAEQLFFAPSGTKGEGALEHKFERKEVSPGEFIQFYMGTTGSEPESAPPGITEGARALSKQIETGRKPALRRKESERLAERESINQSRQKREANEKQQEQERLFEMAEREEDSEW